MSTELKSIHDRLLAEKPEGAQHDEQNCPLCAMGEGHHDQEPEGGSMSTFTQEQVDAAVAEAVQAATEKMAADQAALQAKVTELESAQQETEVGQAVAAATTPLNERISELEAELDAATVAKAAAEQAKAEVETFWAEAIAETEKTAELEAKKAERLEEIKDFKLPDEFVAARADSFAAMSDEDWAARIEEWKAIASLEGSSTIPGATALTASREGGTGGTNHNGSMLSELPSLRRSLTDPRTL